VAPRVSGRRHPLSWSRPAALLALAALLCAGCLGTLRRDPAAAAAADAPAASLGLPRRDGRPYWLLRSQSGWESAYEVRFGGDTQDPAMAVVRVVRFRTADAAARAFARLTPDYLYTVYRDRMAGPPRPFDYPAPLPGDEVSVTLYPVLLPPGAGDPIYGQLTALRAGAAVLLVDSIGVHPPQLVAALEALVRAAARLPAENR
jgi:hypothetical protein